MIDVLLTILVFFMMITSAQVLKVDSTIALPVAADALKQQSTREQAIVNVHWNPATQNNERVTIVGKIDSGGYAELDRGDGIDTSSLRLDGSTLTWTDAGQTRTAMLG